ncbi:3-oxoacyl-[acyl-carrier-protein] synthase-1 [Maritalea mobilis]|uniref:3-oxoacyl-[acyl-carrier-protein] synthase 1 n=1 Tax=Maritalea mobilis TaxID=483324 RepID=A0A4V3DAG2_9HYPH|nr:beta-ketoacyl-ACP synthase I [Maritalea mobilis]TDQ61900.1 3-oxoacyl-[acyl-carrier-protein] synthase-1 [Maritalea mobilis]
MKRVVITGMGIVSSIGNNRAEVLQSLRDAKPGITRAENHVKYGFRSQVHGEPTLDPFSVLDRRTTRFMARGAAWNYIAMQEAIEQAGLEEENISNPRTGIVMGSGGPSTETLINAADITREKMSPKRIGPLAVPKAMSSTASATLATAFKIKGVNYTITSACATSKHCIGNAYEQIQMGKQDIVFAGGSEDLEWSMSNMFDALGAMTSKYNDTPEVASRAYDKNRDGFIIAGGAGVMVLEEYEHAKARGANILAEIVGYGATSDGYDMVAPSGEGAERCMRMALETVNCPIDYINPHATSTPVGDIKEIEAIRAVFGNEDKCPPLSATKSLTGHSLGAVGVQESIYSVMMMNEGFLCESANIFELDPEFEDMPILRERRDNQNIGCVMSNSFGFGGTNATLIFKHPDA